MTSCRPIQIKQCCVSILEIPANDPAAPMHVMTGRIYLTNGDRQFMTEVGIEPCALDDPFPGSLPPSLPPGPVIPALAEKDARWLLNLGVVR